MTSAGKEVRIAIAGIGNCASAFVQGLGFYQRHTAAPEGLIFQRIGGRTVSDLHVVAAFDVDRRKVGRPLAEAIFAAPNCAIRFHEPPPMTSGVVVQMAPILDGVAPHMLHYDDNEAFRPAETGAVDVVSILRNTGTDVLLSYMPVGADEAVSYYAQCCLDAGVAMVNCSPTFIASNEVWAARFEAAGLPIIGDDIKSQLGATIIHRALAKLFEDRGVGIDRTYQLNVGGNTDFLNMLDRNRLVSKKLSKTQSVQSQLTMPLPERQVHIGPSDYVPWLEDNKICFIQIDGRGFGGSPINVELRLSVQDSPNSAAVAIDAVRSVALARDRGIAGSLDVAAAYLMKSPPRQLADDDARRRMAAFIDDNDPVGAPAVSNSHASIEVLSPADLSVAFVERWRRFQNQRYSLQNPFLCPEFTLAVSSVVEGVRVAVIRIGGRIVGFFPFQLVDKQRAGPVAPGFNDGQGVIGDTSAERSIGDLMRGCELTEWHFDQLLAEQQQFTPYHSRMWFSALIDLRRGVKSWRHTLQDAGRRQVEQLERKRRRLEREHGQVSLHAHVGDCGVLKQLLEWKGAQWARSGVADKFTKTWVDGMMHALLPIQHAGFASMLTVLELEGQPIAMHYGLRSQSIWSYWTTVYDRTWREYSPGLLMLLMMAEAAPRLGLSFIDLGMEDFLYKRRLMNASVPVAAGVVRFGH